MHDWKKIVREKLSPLPLSNGRADEVIEEIAQQLESAHEEARSKGGSEVAAMAKALGQVEDWEQLRKQLFRSVEGTTLPVWEQRGIFSPKRAPVWICLALTLALLATSSFRQALAVLPVPFLDRFDVPSNSKAFSEEALQRLEKFGDKQKYARALAFVALHSRDDLRAEKAAEKAIALEPDLTWISAAVSHATYLRPGYDPQPWIERLKAWDPQNGLPYLLQASASIHSDWENRWARYSPITPDLRLALAAEPKWRVPMERAFAAPRVDSYGTKQFALDRQVLEEQGLDRPDMLLIAGLSAPVASLFDVELYATHLLKDVGEVAEKAGRDEEALDAYRKVAEFGERLASRDDHWEEWYSVKLSKAGYQAMSPLLRRTGQMEKAWACEAALAALPVIDPGKWPLLSPAESHGSRSARIISFATPFLATFGVASACWILCALFLRWKPNLNRGVNQLAAALCFSPPALLVACFTIFVSYFPYAMPIGNWTSQRELTDGYGPFLFKLSPIISSNPVSELWLTRMFWPCIGCAVVAIAGVLVLRWRARHEGPDQTGAA